MHPYQSVIGVIAGIIAFISFIPYIISILKGKTKPNRATFAIWGVVNIVTVASYIASGARTTIWTGLAYAMLQVLIFGLSFKYGMGGFNKLDVICLSAAAIGIVLWISTNNPHTALYLSIFSEALGFLPTFKKSYYHPETEDFLAWKLATIGGLINIAAINAWRIDIALYPVYILTFDTSVVLLLLLGRRRSALKLTQPLRAKTK